MHARDKKRCSKFFYQSKEITDQLTVQGWALNQLEPYSPYPYRHMSLPVISWATAARRQLAAALANHRPEVSIALINWPCYFWQISAAETSTQAWNVPHFGRNTQTPYDKREQAGT